MTTNEVATVTEFPFFLFKYVSACSVPSAVLEAHETKTSALVELMP